LFFTIQLFPYLSKALEKRQGLGYNEDMVISWFGLSSFKISSGPLTLITDPFSKNTGLTPPRGQTDIVVISNSESDLYNNREAVGDEKTFVVDSPGEYDVKGLFIRGVRANGAAIYSIRLEDIRLGFLGCLKAGELSDAQIEELGDIDVLFVPVGGKSVSDAEEAVKIVNQLEPRFVIPMHYAQPGLKITLDKVEGFLKEIGATSVERRDKFTLKKSELAASDKTETIILTPQR